MGFSFTRTTHTNKLSEPLIVFMYANISIVDVEYVIELVVYV